MPITGFMGSAFIQYISESQNLLDGEVGMAIVFTDSTWMNITGFMGSVYIES